MMRMSRYSHWCQASHLALLSVQGGVACHANRNTTRARRLVPGRMENSQSLCGTLDVARCVPANALRPSPACRRGPAAASPG